MKNRHDPTVERRNWHFRDIAARASQASDLGTFWFSNRHDYA
jgi:hypothetical protein